MSTDAFRIITNENQKMLCSVDYFLNEELQQVNPSFQIVPTFVSNNWHKNKHPYSNILKCAVIQPAVVSAIALVTSETK